MFVSRLLPAEFGNKEKLEAQLREKLRTAEKRIDYALQNSICPMRFLKKNFRQGDDNYLVRVEDDRQKLNVFYRIDKYIRDKRDMVQETTLTTIRCIKKHLLGFEDYQKKAITFDCSNVKSYGGLLKYLTYEAPLLRRNRIIRGLKVNTIGKTIKHLKSFLKDRMERKIIPFMDLSFFKSMEEEVDAVYLSWDELSKIYHLDLSLYPYLIKYRDLFVLGCLTGLRFSDYSNIQSDELRNGMLYIVQRKTLSSVIIPLREDARKILVGKYNLLIPRVSAINFNYYVKEVVCLAGIIEPIKISHKKGNQIMSEVKPKYAWVSSHTAVDHRNRKKKQMTRKRKFRSKSQKRPGGPLTGLRTNWGFVWKFQI